MFNIFYTNLINDLLPFDSDDYNRTCNAILTKNMTLIEIDRGWEGIPESLVINLLVCLALILPFVVFRCYICHRNSDLLSNKQRTNWVQFIYGDRHLKKRVVESQKLHVIESNLKKFHSKLLIILPFHSASCKNQKKKKYSYGSSSNSTTTHNNFSPSNIISEDSKSSSNQPHNSDDFSGTENVNDVSSGSINGSQSNLVQVETTFFSSLNQRHSSVFIRYGNRSLLCCWQRFFTTLLNISDDDILKNKGHDAYQYLLFQRYIIIFLLILSLICISIILPINIQGNNEGKAFARTSLSNLPNDSDMYWAHAICSAFIFVFGIFLMNRFANELKVDDGFMFYKTLLIRRLPVTDNITEKLSSYLSENFPDVRITGIQLITDIQNLESQEQEYINAVNGHKYCQEKNAENESEENRYKLRPYCLSQVACFSQCCCNKVDAENYYQEQQNKMKKQISQELEKLTTQKMKSAFVAFETEQMAIQVYKEIKSKQNDPLGRLANVCFSSNDSLDLMKCIVTFAPFPDDVNWRDIGIDLKWLWLRKVAISIALFIIFFFLSTPSFLLKIFELFATRELIQKGRLISNSILTDFLSPFFLMLLAVILPSIVTYTSQLIPYKTISDLNHAVMSKVYAFLLIMVIILPSTGFLSINAMLENILSVKNSDSDKFRWNCLFPVDNGAFFVIYALQAGLIGNVSEILRLPELILYFVYNMFLPSQAEYEKARKWVTFDFPFGVSYPRFLLIFTMTIIYSFACPLIAPCGLLYMFGKHLVDRYNIYHVYSPTKINRRIHSSAILYFYIGLIFMTFQLFSVIILKTRYSTITLFMLSFLVVSLLVLFYYCFKLWLQNVNRLEHITAERKSRVKQDFCICSYSPPVLYRLLDDGLLNPKNLDTKTIVSDSREKSSEQLFIHVDDF